VDPARFGAALGDGSFDAVLHVWHSDPSPTAILQLWGAPGAAGRGTSNATGYRSAAFEALVDSAARTFDRARATTLYARADSLLAEDVPAVFLYESRQVAGMHRRLRPTGLRADAWWANLAAWRVAPGEAIARDRLGAPQR
jgi:peptide/nickel transport system substrate-binding protein